MLRMDPRLAEIMTGLHERIREATKRGWLGEIEGLQVSLAGAEDKLAQIERRCNTTPPSTTAKLGVPAFPAES